MIPCVSRSVCAAIYLSSLPIELIHPPLSVPIYLSIHLCVSVDLSLVLPIHLSVHLCISLSLSLSIYPSICLSAVNLHISSISLSVSLSLLSVHPYPSIYLSICREPQTNPTSTLRKRFKPAFYKQPRATPNCSPRANRRPSQGPSEGLPHATLPTNRPVHCASHFSSSPF